MILWQLWLLFHDSKLRSYWSQTHHISRSPLVSYSSWRLFVETIVTWGMATKGYGYSATKERDYDICFIIQTYYRRGIKYNKKTGFGMNKRGIDFASAWANPHIDLSKEMALYVWMGGVGILVGGTGGWTRLQGMMNKKKDRGGCHNSAAFYM